MESIPKNFPIFFYIASQKNFSENFPKKISRKTVKCHKTCDTLLTGGSEQCLNISALGYTEF